MMIPIKLLLVEDQESDAALEIRQLERAGYQVEWTRVENEAEYQAALAGQPWDLILADYHLPTFDAPAALAVLQETGQDIPFIVVSGAIGEETAVDLMRSGASDYLLKGKLARLGPAVERELAEAQVRRERVGAYQALREKMEESQKRAHELETISMIAAEMRCTQTRPELVTSVLANLLELLDAQFATLAYMDDRTLIFESAVGSAAPWQVQRLSTEAALPAQVLQTGLPLILPEPHGLLPGWVEQNLTPQSGLMIYPLASATRVIGLILISYDRPGGVSSEQLNLVAAVASMAGNAIHRMLAAEELERMVERREKELEHIYQVTSAASQSLDQQQALRQALILTLNAVQAETGGIYLTETAGGGAGWVVTEGPYLNNTGCFEQVFPLDLVNAALEQKQTQLAPTPNQETTASAQLCPCADGAVIALPMHSQDRVIGALVVRVPKDRQVIVEELTLLSFIADQLALVTENTRLHNLAEQAAVLDERSRLARELHDSVVQLLYSANLYTSSAQRWVAQSDLEKSSDHLQTIGLLLQQALKDMRLLVYQLRSSDLAQNGLTGALQSRLDAVERRAGIQVEFQPGSLAKLPERVEEQLYRIAIEALNNSIKHAQAARLWISIEQRIGCITLKIRDDGRGFNPAAPLNPGGIGLKSMRERAESLDGQLIIESTPGCGTTVIVSIPENLHEPR